MATEIRDDIPYWFVLNHIGSALQTKANKTIERFNRWQNCNLETFAPTYVIREEKDGEVRMKTASLTFHYVFVRGTLPQIKLLCGQSNGFSFLIDRGSESRYAVIPDREMASFKNIARAYKNCLPYFPLEEIDLEDGDLVEVIKGDFPGLIGTFMPKAKSKSGNIVLNVFNNVGTIAFNIKATDVRVLEFSKKSTRANDQIDAFVPRLLKALRVFHAEEAIPSSLLAQLMMFCRRMEVVRINNHKLDAKLQALLYGGNFILGNISAAELSKTNYIKLSEYVTNEWTQSLINLIFSVIENDMDMLKNAFQKINGLEATSKTQFLLKSEYIYYFSDSIPNKTAKNIVK